MDRYSRLLAISATAIVCCASTNAWGKGPASPGGAFIKDHPFASVAIEGNAFVDFMTLSLPAGSYLVNAAAFVAGAAGATVQCIIRSGNAPVLGNDVSGTGWRA